MPDAAQRMQILLRLERGEITPAEAEQLLNGAADPPPAANTRMGILEQVERGQLGADEAARLLLNQSGPRVQAQQHERPAEQSISFAPVSGGKSKLWKFFLIVGLVFTVGAALWMNASYQNHGINFWFLCAWLPLALGIAMAVLGTLGQNSTWLQMKVRSQDENKRIYLTLPLPIGVIERIAAKFSKTGRVVVTEADGPNVHMGGEPATGGKE